MTERFECLVCGPIDGDPCEIPNGLYYDDLREGFRCKAHGYRCKRVCPTSGKLRKDVFKDANVLKLSLVRKNLKSLCSYLKDNPETMDRRDDKCSGCGQTIYYRCKICQRKVCGKCNDCHVSSFVVCDECLIDAKEIGDIERQVKPLEKKIRMLEDKMDAFRDRQMEIATFWNRKKLWERINDA